MARNAANNVSPTTMTLINSPLPVPHRSRTSRRRGPKSLATCARHGRSSEVGYDQSSTQPPLDSVPQRDVLAGVDPDLGAAKRTRIEDQDNHRVGHANHSPQQSSRHGFAVRLSQLADSHLLAMKLR